MLKCHNVEYKGNILMCASTGKECNLKICHGCKILDTVNYYTAAQAINKLLDNCEKCYKYYQCDRVLELQDKLKEYEP